MKKIRRGSVKDKIVGASLAAGLGSAICTCDNKINSSQNRLKPHFSSCPVFKAKQKASKMLNKDLKNERG